MDNGVPRLHVRHQEPASETAAVLREVRLLLKTLLRRKRRRRPPPQESIAAPFRFSADFREVHWHGQLFRFSKTQAAIVELLHQAKKADTPDVQQAALLEQAGSQSMRLTELFRRGDGARAWGLFIIQGDEPGSYRLAESPTVARLPRLPKVTPLERLIVKAASADPAPPKQLATAVGHACDPYFYGTLRKVIDKGVLEKVAGDDLRLTELGLRLQATL